MSLLFLFSWPLLPDWFQLHVTALEAFSILLTENLKFPFGEFPEPLGAYFKYICCAGDVRTKPWASSLAQNEPKFIISAFS